ncbi:MAG TPA: carotenoid oxygenase family protein [Burkholderiaceae bacterium]|nr:carotenoid oxygenase family protein [Burkholderiaceae bacterium]
MALADVVENNKAWLAGLADSMTTEHDYFAEVEGHLPTALQGTLYRNGPGRFELGGVRKRHLLDGDGMIQAFDFVDGKVRYRNRFVRTRKYLIERDAGRFVTPTWTTRAPGGMVRNVGNKIRSQAGVTTLIKNDCLYAFDEVGLPYGLDPDSLETRGEQQVGPPGLRTDYKAHTKTDPATGEWLILGIEHGPRTWLNLVHRAADGSLLSHQRFSSPRPSYIHDWFLTEHYVLILLHPVELSLPRFLSGLASFTDSLQWRPRKGNLLLLVDRSGASEPIAFDAEACFMWHSINAFEVGDSLVADFIGYDEPDHFLGDRAAFRMIMEGKQGAQMHKGILRRYIINLPRRRLIEDRLSPENHEFPVIDSRMVAQRYRYGYFTTSRAATVFHNGIARVSADGGQRDTFFMDESTHMGEPIFVPDGPEPEDGWLLSVGLDGASGRSFLAIFRSDRLADGPVARVGLQHSTPLSFHGYWYGR